MDKKIIILISIIGGMIGLGLIINYGNWQIAFGIFICIWANNMSFGKGGR